jgi:hypothetical protein
MADKCNLNVTFHGLLNKHINSGIMRTIKDTNVICYI